jgi:cell wall-associated NlpC family hydrolase
MRFEFINYLKSFIGARYQWTGEGPYNIGFDCSGLILEGFRAFGFSGKEDMNSQSIHGYLMKKGFKHNLGKPDIGDIVFFGKDINSITHIGVMINNWQYIEAGGGDSKTVDKGMVRLRPLTWRKDLVACVIIFKDNT